MKQKKFLVSILSAIMAIIIGTNVFAAMPTWGEEIKNQPSANYTQKFTDVPSNHWAFKYIGEMTNRGVLAGYPNGMFYPDQFVTRAQFAKIMTSAAGIVNMNDDSAYWQYDDLEENQWYIPYISAANYYLSSYVLYEDGYAHHLFMPDNNALREDIAVALVLLKGYESSLYDETLVKTMFTDWQSISDEARKFVAIAVEKGLISGYEDNTFRGQDSITRAEAAALLWRAYQYGSGNKVFDTGMVKEPEVEKPQPTATPEPVKTPEPTKKPEATKKPESTEKPEVDEDDEEEVKKPEKKNYLYNLSTIASGVDKMEYMISNTNGDIYYLTDGTIMKAEKNGNRVTEVLNEDDIEPLCDTTDMSKSDIAHISYDIITIGYNENDDCLYALLTASYDYKYYIYNVTDNSVLYYTADLRGDERYPFIRESPIRGEFHSTITFDENNAAHCFGRRIDFNGGGFSTSRNPIYGNDSGYNSAKYYIMNNQVVSIGIGFNKITYLDKRSGGSYILDYYIEDGVKSMIGANENYFYAVGEDQNIYTIDIDGESKAIFSIDDIDNIDGKPINLNAIENATSCVDDDGTIYYWDINYRAIRQIAKN